MTDRRLARPVRAVGAAAVVAAAAWAPAVASIQPVRVGLTPRLLPGALSGISPEHHVALTYDDGPDPASTPAFLDLLGRYDVRATFFVLGRHAVEQPDLLRRMVAEGHEVGVHGWTHRCVALHRPGRIGRRLQATKDVLEHLTGQPVRWYRPPYGVLTTEVLVASRAAGLSTVLWSAWGRDWERAATPDRIVATVRRALRPGGTILLHDTDRESAPGSWRRTLVATERLLREAALDAPPLGPLREHWAARP